MGICKQCGCEFEEHSKKKIGFCSHRCSALYKRWNYEPNHKCPVCEVEFYVKPSHWKKNKTSCCSIACSNKLRSKTFSGENNHQYGLKGDKNASFKGDRVEHGGYYMVYKPNHPFANERGRVLEHRIVAESQLLSKFNSVEIDGEMFLDPKFDVHHIDLDKHNNHIDNLIVLTRSQHTTIHNQISDKFK